MSSDGIERVGCYRWKREDCKDTFWSSYPGASEQYDSQEATILFWDVETDTDRPEEIDVAHLLARQWVMENVDGADEETMDPIAGQTPLEGWS